MNILILNSGSSSIKFELIDTECNHQSVKGRIERIGEAESDFNIEWQEDNRERKHYQEFTTIADHKTGLRHCINALITIGIIKQLDELDGIGHRIVHGGDVFTEAVKITDNTLHKIYRLSQLAPLHNPAGIAGIEVALQLAPAVPQVAIFDTAFHQTLPPEAYLYALPWELQQKHGLRRYGFHGTSHQYVTRMTARYLSRPENTLNLITLHLGNGASATAIRNGSSVDTSMGLTPLEGLVMGTRSGDIDPSIPSFLIEHAGYTPIQVGELLNSASGLKGLCGANDMREVLQLADDGNEQAEVALKLFCYRIKKYIGAYFAILGRLDALVFTAGIGEHSSEIRRRCCMDLQHLGITINAERNRKAISETVEISDPDADIKVLVVPTNEELEIAQATRHCLNRCND